MTDPAILAILDTLPGFLRRWYCRLIEEGFPAQEALYLTGVLLQTTTAAAAQRKP